VASWRTPCSRTPLVRAYADLVVRGLRLHGRTHYAHPTPPRTVTVTYMARRASSQWPERRFCDSTDSFFKCEDWQHLDKRSLGRMIRNDDAVVASLKTLEQREWKNGAAVIVSARAQCSLRFILFINCHNCLSPRANSFGTWISTT